MPPDFARADALRARLDGAPVDHARFTGPPVDVKDWTPEELGVVWGALHRAARFGHDDIARRALASTLLEQVTQACLAPLLAGEAFLDALDAAGEYNGEWEYVVACLACLQGEVPAGTAAQARRILGETSGWAERHYQAYLLARLAGGDAPALFMQQMQERHARYPMPLTLQELELLAQLKHDSLLALAGSRHSSFWNRDSIGEPDPAEVLAGDAAYIAFARAILEQAAGHIAAIHDGRVPYAADAAFATHDSPVLARAARLAAYRDEDWFRPVIVTLLPLVCIAPGTAKSAPSQSLAMALGHAVETVPTPESLQALRTALAQVRHAGIRKKLERNLKPAERALAERADIAWRLGLPGQPGKRRQAMLARALEAGLASEVRWKTATWRALQMDADGEIVARALVWRTDKGKAFMLDGEGVIDAQGGEVALPDDSEVTLWHPLHGSEAERAAWQAQISKRRLRQPVRQAYREIYLPPQDGSVPFADHALSVRPLLGLARREGWRLDTDEGLSRQFGAWRVSLRLEGRVYPGAEGACTSDGLAVDQRVGSHWQAIEANQMAPVAYSEACRAIDLLVSASAFALADDDQDEQRGQRLAYLATLETGPMVGMRRAVLEQVFAKQLADGRMAIATRHLMVGRHAIHLATARVTLDGVEMVIDVAAKGGKLGAMPWLPHDEALLEKIAGLAGQLLKR
ncbi:DUF4132 domain-containing protein [Janthinobacterium sp. J1-1]|uniref:DUF4132 domain-containing protein n=1 Tax=Janthinobacterium sp. J1-1 TaxID=3065910 RepID=UPI00281207EB|nr:DUF4132 domain-containing protein [Janthinobacterium sp. J1-1]